MAAAKHGWPGAALAWLGLRNDQLNNVLYDELAVDVRGEPFRDQLVDDLLSERGSEAGHVVLVALLHGHYHMLRYLPVTDVADSFRNLFPDGRVPMSFFRTLANPPFLECKRNGSLPAQLEFVATALLRWMPQLDLQRLRREVAASGDIRLAAFLRNCRAARDRC